MVSKRKKLLEPYVQYILLLKSGKKKELIFNESIYRIFFTIYFKLRLWFQLELSKVL